MVPSPYRFYRATSILLLIASFSISFAHAATEAADSALPDVAETTRTAGRLACKPCSLDFGKVRIGQAKALPLILVNEGHTSITISSKYKHAPSITPKGLTLPHTLLPGRQVEFRVVFSPRDAQNLNGKIAYHSNARNRLLPISLTGETASGGMLVATPVRLDFGNVAVGSSASRSQTITNVGKTNVLLEQVTPAGIGFSIGGVTTPQTLAPGHSVTFTVQFVPQKSGADTGSVIALSNATNYRLSVVTTGIGTAAGSVSLTPSSVAFGNVPVGSNKTKTLTLTATGATMAINSDTLNSSEYSISGLALPLKLAAGKSVSFQATFAPQTGGTANASLSFAVGTSGSTVSSSLSGTGTSGAQHSVNLSWKADSSQVAGYNVYRSDKSSGPYLKLSSPLDTSTEYVDTGVTAGNTYYYQVTAVSDQGAESAPSAPVGATVP